MCRCVSPPAATCPQPCGRSVLAWEGALRPCVQPACPCVFHVIVYKDGHVCQALSSVPCPSHGPHRDFRLHADTLAALH